ncbi:MAG: tRNA pseudouridine(55) synthase TruB [Deltaproteobacteria bacterium]|nr:tRNA pseudouridine(55) synthase TruB [Deltaproteobacteria bacterium]
MLLNINKPRGMTSHDVVDIVRRMTGEKRVGHAGTLDPFATGVLVVAVTREFTKQLEAITKNTEKEYEALVVLGQTSTTGDRDGALTSVVEQKNIDDLDESFVKKILERFVGDIEQTPPAYSAIKVGGIPAYKLARKGKPVVLTARKVRIIDLKLLDFSAPTLRLSVTCSAGTYIRTLAEDIGRKLNTGAYVEELTRTRVGDFRIEDSQTLQQLQQQLSLLR